MLQSQRLYFIALLPPQEIQDYANQIKQYFSDNYSSRHAQKSPPHITLQPPFQWTDAEVPKLEECLKDFASRRESVPITLSGFGAFAPRVIYINVVRSLELLTLHTDLMLHLESNLGIIDKVGKTRPFAPHMTVAFRDLSKQNFKAAWSEFEKRQLHFEFAASDLKLLVHDGSRWNINSEFLLQKAYLRESP
ncbi:MAG: 2'-5' RNA ligase family protein [Brasilonema octagenarum HA4186-MV1]|jgi:2'-5' RNA ligase|uniref:2'-5' RNA ligase family protein n=1 Tax=Brasilonema sennae CENA114 TaxID=415709 RepID=A0A856MHM3_9CYAN|nr:2'-5' RNA ligase family protein [Brasilonema sennae]MBW4627406.1 2'-5' RNA ligase family protein [Brasilonema octagenarum HA4186-MV1]QDL09131.1 2'-5' RNA ligase family protein [Brasilonema sennae CENA114]QDL15488.1 2'-5' RNA ligase family protein [Brasilonema octagenarum UFV-E1]